MLVEFYIGLAAIGAGLLAIYVAALLVVAQMGSETFSPTTPYFILRRTSVIATAGLALLVTSLAILLAIRSAFPDFDALPGDQGTGIILHNAWFAIGLGGGVLFSAVLSGIVLFNFAATLRGPGLVKAMVNVLEAKDWAAWLDFADPPASPSLVTVLARIKNESEDTAASRPPTRQTSGTEIEARLKDVAQDIEAKVVTHQTRQTELKELHRSGKLADPLAPIVEVAVAAIEGRRYALVDRILGDLTNKVDEWLENADSLGLDIYRSGRSLLRHLDDLIDVAFSAAAESQLAVVIRHTEDLGVRAVDRDDRRLAAMIQNQLAEWVKRFVARDKDQAAATAISSAHTLASTALQSGNFDLFNDAVIALGRTGETLAANYRAEQTPVLPGTWEDSGRDPVATLANAFYQITRQFGGGGQLIGFPTALVDAISVTVSAFLKCPESDEHADGIASGLVFELKDIGLVAAKTMQGNAVLITAYALKHVAEDARDHGDDQTLDAVAFAAFEIGMITYANDGNFEFDGMPASTDLVDRLVDACNVAGDHAMARAVPSLYQRGHTMHTPDEAQKKFLEKVESRMGTTFERYR